MANIHTLTSTDIHDVTTEKNGVLGKTAVTADGRKYRYAKNGATALVAGATVTKSTTVDYTSTANAARKVADGIVTTAGTVTAANAPKYEDGTLTIASAKYLAGGVAQDGTISLIDKLDRPVAASTATSLAANQFCGVVAGASNVIGTAEVAVPANAYFWAFISA